MWRYCNEKCVYAYTETETVMLTAISKLIASVRPLMPGGGGGGGGGGGIQLTIWTVV